MCIRHRPRHLRPHRPHRPFASLLLIYYCASLLLLDWLHCWLVLILGWLLCRLLLLCYSASVLRLDWLLCWLLGWLLLDWLLCWLLCWLLLVGIKVESFAKCTYSGHGGISQRGRQCSLLLREDRLL